MRSEMWVATALLAITPLAQQRGVLNGVSVPKAAAQAGVPVEITVTGTNPCGAIRIDPGDGTERVTYPITQVPTTVRHIYQRGGRFEVRAEGMGNCDGVVATSIQVTPAAAPPRAAAPPPPTTASNPRVSQMDTNGDGRVTRAEWRRTDDEFRAHDINNDGMLSGTEIRDDLNDVIVKAAERWTRTNVEVRRGEVLRIESTGVVQLSARADDTSTPGGAASGRRAPSAPLPDRPAGGLIARIGNGVPLFVGADSSVRANATGRVYLGVNDDELADNRGEFRVKIDVAARGRDRR